MAQRREGETYEVLPVWCPISIAPLQRIHLRLPADDTPQGPIGAPGRPPNLDPSVDMAQLLLPCRPSLADLEVRLVKVVPLLLRGVFPVVRERVRLG